MFLTTLRFIINVYNFIYSLYSSHQPSLSVFIIDHLFVIKIIQIYVVTAGSVFLILIIIKRFSFILHILQSFVIVISKYLIYLFVVRYYPFFGLVESRRRFLFNSCI